MLVRPNSDDLRVISYYFGRVLLVFGAFTGLPFLWALIAREWSPASSLLLTAGAAALLGVLASSVEPREHRLDWSHGMVVVALTWLVVPALGAIPLALSGHFANYLDAYFDAMSGLTASGSSLIQDLDHLAPSLNFFRHLLLFVGGQGIVLAAVTVFAGSVGLSMFQGEGREDRILPSVGSTARFIWWVSFIHLVVGVVVLGAVAYFELGFTPGRSVFHGALVFFSAFDTGGFTVQSTSIGYYHSLLFEGATMVFMVAGAMSFGLHYALWRGRRRLRLLADLEARSLAFSVVITMGLLIAGLATLGFYRSTGALARQGLFHLISAHTSSGLTLVPSAEIAQWGGLAFVGVTAAMFVGGMASSTAGGLKAIRVGLVARVLKDQVKRVLLPERAVISTVYHQAGRRRLTTQTAQAAMLVTLLFIGLMVVGTVVGMAYGYPLEKALYESVSASTNGGLSAGIYGPHMPVLLEVTYIVQMWLGRLEFAAVFGLIGYGLAIVRGR